MGSGRSGGGLAEEALLSYLISSIPAVLGTHEWAALQGEEGRFHERFQSPRWWLPNGWRALGGGQSNAPSPPFPYLPLQAHAVEGGASCPYFPCGT